jgi:ADP-ribose pyrophosphatase YjhB (NUDIX family)
MDRPYWSWVSVPPRKTVAGIILLRNDRAALLQLRDEKPTIQDPGIWVVPGGHIEPGETPLDGACRGLKDRIPRGLSIWRFMTASKTRPLLPVLGD